MSRLTRYILQLILYADIILAVGLLAEQKLAGVDAALYAAVGSPCAHAISPATLQQSRKQTSDSETVLLQRHTRSYPAVGYTVWSEAADGAELALPKIQELATLVHCLTTKHSVQAVAVSVPLEWQDSDDRMAHYMLGKALREARCVVVGMAGRTAALAAPTPEGLADAIPPDHISGSVGTLASANTPLPYCLPAQDAQPLYAPDYVEDEPLTHGEDAAQGLSLPLIMRWNGAVLPTLPLRLALAAQGLTAADVRVRMGKSLMIGRKIWPIDAHGRTPLGAARAQAMPVETALTAPRNAPSPAYAVISHAFSPTHSGQRGERLAATVSALLSSDTISYIPTVRPVAQAATAELNPLQRTLIGRIALIAAVACLLIWLPQLTRRTRRRILGALGAGILLLGIVWETMGLWMSVSAWVLCWLLTMAACRLLTRSHHAEARSLKSGH